jgi:nodulation protein E
MPHVAAHRVAITGIGVISAIGLNRHQFWTSLVEGKSGIGEFEQPEFGPIRFKNAAVVRGYNPEEYFHDKTVAFMDRFAQFSVIAAREAVEQSGVEWTADLRERTAIVTGSCIGGRIAEEAGYWNLFHLNKNRVHPLTIPLGMANSGASQVSMEFGVHGPTFTFSTACSSSGHALGHAFWMVRSGAAPMAIAGGADAPVYFGNMKAWEAMRVVSPDTCRPFSKDRAGMILGEGAAMLVLEPMDVALARGATPIAEITGFGMSSDASHITQPLAEGAARAIRGALKDAGIALEDIGYINAHGTGTEANDKMECAAIRSVFGAHADKLQISSTKSMHGHTLGAAGAIESAATAFSLQRGILPPTANFTEPDPECDLDVIPNEARVAGVEQALSTSFAFGGLNAVLAFRAVK